MAFLQGREQEEDQRQRPDGGVLMSVERWIRAAGALKVFRKLESPSLNESVASSASLNLMMTDDLDMLIKKLA